MSRMMDQLKRTARHPVLHFTLSLLFALIIAIAGEAFGGVRWLIAGAAVSCAVIALTGQRAFLHERAIRGGKIRFSDRYVIVIGLVTVLATGAAFILVGRFAIQSIME